MAKEKIILEDCKIIFRNFSGKGSKFNPEGQRNFCVILENEMAEDLKAKGFNVKALKPREEGDPLLPYIQVKVNYNNVPPKIYIVTKKGKTLLDEQTVKELDNAEIEMVDLIINPNQWEVRGEKGYSAYVDKMYVTIVEDYFASRYSFDEEETVPFE